MKRTVWTTTIMVALVALVSIPLVAHPQGQPQGRGFGRGMGMGPGGPGGPGGGPSAFLRGINLTDAQREQIRAIMDEHRDDAEVGKVGGLNKQLQLAILAGDAAKIDETKAALAAAMSEQLARRIEVETKIAQVLTAEQKTKARENIETQGPPRGRGRH